MKRFLTILALLSIFAVSASAQLPLRHDKSRKQLEADNATLRSRLDSLSFVLDSLSHVIKENSEEEIVPVETAPESADFMRHVEYSQEMTDSLLERWYNSTLWTDGTEKADYDMDVEHFSSDVSDEVMIQRLAGMNAYFTLPFNETVKNYMILYSEKMRGSMGRIMGLAEYYFPIFEEAFARYGLPQELKYLSIIESMLNPVATSRVGAKGMWQFMYNTARSYGLRIDSYMDERLDVEKAVDAAARHLRDSYKVFGDWSLAISAYNCGPGNVSKAIKRAGGKRDFWSIYPFLPRETRGYMPAFVGAMYAMTYHREYGIEPKDVGMPAVTDTFHISRKLHFKQINEVVGVPLEDIQRLNPQYIHSIIPGSVTDVCVINLPYTWTNAFMDADQDSLYLHKYDELFSADVLKGSDAPAKASAPSNRTVYKVKSGDSLSRIASRYHVTIKQLKSWNHLKSDMLRVGQVIYIYK